MMGKGFITTATLERAGLNETEFTELHICDLAIGKANDEDFAVEIFIGEIGATLNLTLPEAKAATEALQEIISRYEK